MSEKLIICIVVYLVSIVLAYLVVRITYINERFNKLLMIGEPDGYGLFMVVCPLVNTCIAVSTSIILLGTVIGDKFLNINYAKFFKMPTKITKNNNMEENVK